MPKYDEFDLDIQKTTGSYEGIAPFSGAPDCSNIVSICLRCTGGTECITAVPCASQPSLCGPGFCR